MLERKKHRSHFHDTTSTFSIVLRFIPAFFCSILKKQDQIIHHAPWDHKAAEKLQSSDRKKITLIATKVARAV